MHTINDAAQRRLLSVSGRARSENEKPLPPKVEAYLKGHAAVIKSDEVPEGSEERRRHERLSLMSEILVRRVGGFNFQVQLADISKGGCRVEMLEPCELDDAVIARFPHLEPLGSRVCWTNGTTTGMQFQTSIHPAVFDMLLSRLSEGVQALA